MQLAAELLDDLPLVVGVLFSRFPGLLRRDGRVVAGSAFEASLSLNRHRLDQGVFRQPQADEDALGADDQFFNSVSASFKELGSTGRAAPTRDGAARLRLHGPHGRLGGRQQRQQESPIGIVPRRAPPALRSLHDHVAFSRAHVPLPGAAALFEVGLEDGQLVGHYHRRIGQRAIYLLSLLPVAGSSARADQNRLKAQWIKDSFTRVGACVPGVGTASERQHRSRPSPTFSYQ